ncbi:MAG TPA: hypothetical protein VF836_07020 [Gemmatimonadaceae bacterium]
MLFQAWTAGEHRNIAGRPTDVRRRKAKYIRRRSVEAGDAEVSSQDNDGNFNGIKDVNEISRGRVYVRVVTSDPVVTGPAATGRNARRRHQAAFAAV